MALMKLGSKAEVFHREGCNWFCRTGLPSDVTIEVEDMAFHLHKFPLLSRSGILEQLIREYSGKEGSVCHLRLHEIPDGAKSFELTAKFCYGVKMELTALNVVSLRCAAEYLRMTDDYGEGNLITQTETFLNEVFSNWNDTIKALETCEKVLPYAEEYHIVSRCIDSLAMKACADPSLLNWPVESEGNEKKEEKSIIWNGISTDISPKQPTGEGWWYEDVAHLSLPLYKRFILAVGTRNMKPENIAASLVYYIKRHLPLMNRQSSFNDAEYSSTLPEADQKTLLEEIVGLLPGKKEVVSSEFLLRLLRSAMILHASPACRENLEKRVGAQLDQASLIDLLIPNMGYAETLYDIDCVQRMFDYFMLVNQPGALLSSPCILEEGQLMGGYDSLGPMTKAASLVDGYLAEVSPDVNLKLPKFEALASVIPGYARPLDDGIYHAIDIYLKAHPWITDSEREQICRLMDCQKLSLEASTHAAQNERLPLRVIVQVLFFEQLRLRTSISGWLFVDSLESCQNPSGNLGLPRIDGAHQTTAPPENGIVGGNNMRERVCELEKECSTMKEELQKLVKTKRSWKIFVKKLGLKLRLQPYKTKESTGCNLKEIAAPVNANQNLNNSAVVH